MTTEEKTQTIYTSQMPVSSNNLIAECSRQYEQLTAWRCVCFLCFPVLLGLLLIFVIDTQERQLREKIASSGQDAQAWEASLLPKRKTTYLYFFGTIFGIILFGIVALSLIPPVAPREQPHRIYIGG